MNYKELLTKRLERKKNELNELERIVNTEGIPSSVDKRKYIEVKAVINELELCIDIAETMFNQMQE